MKEGVRGNKEGEGTERGRGREKIIGSKKDKQNGQEVLKSFGPYCQFYFLYYFTVVNQNEMFCLLLTRANMSSQYTLQ